MKKTLALLLALVMVFSLAACGGEPTVTTEPQSTGTVPPAVTEPVTEEPALGTLPLVPEGEEVTLTIGIQSHANVIDYETNAFTKYLEELSGVNIDFVMFSADATEATQQLNAMIAGGEELPDILMHFGVDAALRNELGQDGYFVDVKPLFEKYAYWYHQRMEEVVATGIRDQATIEKMWTYATDPTTGAVYCVPGFNNYNSDSCGSIQVINKNWLDAIGRDIPTTVEELREVLELFATEDPNGNGKQDEIPMLGFFNGYTASFHEFISNAWIYNITDYMFNVDENGNLYFPYTTDEYREALRYMNGLYEDGLLSPLSFTLTKSADMKPLITPAEGDVTVGVGVCSPLLAMDKNEAATQYVPLNFLEGVTDLGGYANYTSDGYFASCFITTDCEDPVLAYKLIDLFNNTDVAFSCRYGVEGEQWRYATEEDDPTLLGISSEVVVLENVTGSPNNVAWGYNACYIYVLLTSSTPKDPTDPSQVGSYLANTSAADQMPLRKSDVVHQLVYDEEGAQIEADTKSLVQTYLDEQIALFVAGTLDIDDDATWNNYCKTYEDMGLASWLEAAQKAYDNMNG